MKEGILFIAAIKKVEISCDQKIIFELTDDVIGCDREGEAKLS